MSRNFKFEWSCDYEDDSTFFTHINDIPEDEPCALHSCLTAVADLFERPLYGGPKDPEFEKTIPEGCNFPPIHEDDCRRYAEEHHLIFELTMDDDFNCIAVYIDAPTEFIGVCSDREVELYEEDKAKKKAFVDSVLSKLEEQAGQAVTMSQDELVAKLAKTQDENEGLKNDIKDLAYSYEELREVNAKLRDERRDLSFENATLKNDIENLQQDNFELSSALEATEQALDDALRQVAGFKASDAYFKSRIEEIEQLKRDNSDMGMQVLRANIRAQEIADSYEKLKADTCDYEYLLKENEKLIKANEEYRCENVLLQHHVESISSQIAELEKEVHRVTKIIKANKHSA